MKNSNMLSSQPTERRLQDGLHGDISCDILLLVQMKKR